MIAKVISEKKVGIPIKDHLIPLPQVTPYKKAKKGIYSDKNSLKSHRAGEMIKGGCDEVAD